MNQPYLFPAIHHVHVLGFAPLYGGVILYLLSLLYRDKNNLGIKKIIISLGSLVGALLLGEDIPLLVIKLSIFTTPFIIILFQRLEIVEEGIKPFCAFILLLWGVVGIIELVRVFDFVSTFWYSMLLISIGSALDLLLIIYFYYACNAKQDLMVSKFSKKGLKDVLSLLMVGVISTNAVMLSLLGNQHAFFSILSFSTLVALHTVLVFCEYNHATVKKRYLSALNREEGASSMLEDEGVSDDAAILLRLVKLFEQEKLYLNPEVTVSHVAGKIYTNRTYLSRALNKRTSKNFSQFVNYYRVKEVCGLFITTPDARIQDLSEQCGFNTPSSFANSFRLNTGYSPVEWSKEIRRKQGNREKIAIEDYIL